MRLELKSVFGGLAFTILYNEIEIVHAKDLFMALEKMNADLGGK